MNFHPEQVVKPLLRGWFHALAVPFAIVILVILCWFSYDDLPRMYSMLVFGISSILLYSVSAVYHLFHWQGSWRKFWQTFDHANIFVLIAGTYTPICFNVLSGWIRPAILVLIWTMALIGVVISFFGNRIKRWLRTTFYIGMGWVAVLVFPALISTLPLHSLALLLLGGLLYTAGAVIYAIKRPDPMPRWFGFHEIFHLFVIAGGLAFTVHIFLWVLPYPRT